MDTNQAAEKEMAAADPAQVARDAAATLGNVNDADPATAPVQMAPQGDSRGVQATDAAQGAPTPTNPPSDDTRPANVPEPVTDGSAAPPEENAARADAQPLPVDPGPAQVQAFDAAMNMQAQQAQASDALRQMPEGASYLTRDQIREAQKAKRTQGVEIYLPETGTKALVRDLPFGDHALIQGMPLEMVRAIDATIRDKNLAAVATGQVQPKTLEESLELFGKAEQMANAYCTSAFLRPRLVMTEAELDASDPDVWLVTDVDINDRIMVLNWSNRNRALDNAAHGGAAATAGFPGAGVANPTNSQAGDEVRQAPA